MATGVIAQLTPLPRHLNLPPMGYDRSPDYERGGRGWGLVAVALAILIAVALAGWLVI